MSDIEFHQTRMGQRFYESTMPALVRELIRLNGNIERLLAVVAGDAKVDTDAPPADEKPEEHR